MAQVSFRMPPAVCIAPADNEIVTSGMKIKCYNLKGERASSITRGPMSSIFDNEQLLYPTVVIALLKLQYFE